MQSMEGSIGTFTRLFWIALVFEFHHVNFSFIPRNPNGERVYFVGHHFVVSLLFSSCFFFFLNVMKFSLPKYIYDS